MRDNAAVPVLLTRPAAQSQAFAQALADRYGAAVAPVIAPVMAIEWVEPAALPGAETLIFTSTNGVDGLRRWWRGPGPAWCVGARTAAHAARAGIDVLGHAPDAEGLVRSLSREGRGAFFHARGRHVASDIAGGLQQAGHDVRTAVVYDQVQQALGRRAVALLRGEAPVIVPLFSPRSAALVVAQAGSPGRGPVPICISPAVFAVLPGSIADRARIAARPDAEALIDAIGRAISTNGAA